MGHEVVLEKGPTETFAPSGDAFVDYSVSVRRTAGFKSCQAAEMSGLFWPAP